MPLDAFNDEQGDKDERLERERGGALEKGADRRKVVDEKDKRDQDNKGNGDVPQKPADRFAGRLEEPADDGPDLVEGLLDRGGGMPSRVYCLGAEREGSAAVARLCVNRRKLTVDRAAVTQVEGEAPRWDKLADHGGVCEF